MPREELEKRHGPLPLVSLFSIGGACSLIIRGGERGRQRGFPGLLGKSRVETQKPWYFGISK